jgi:hypothetical protein
MKKTLTSIFFLIFASIFTIAGSFSAAVLLRCILRAWHAGWTLFAVAFLVIESNVTFALGTPVYFPQIGTTGAANSRDIMVIPDPSTNQLVYAGNLVTFQTLLLHPVRGGTTNYLLPWGYTLRVDGAPRTSHIVVPISTNVVNVIDLITNAVAIGYPITSGDFMTNGQNIAWSQIGDGTASPKTTGQGAQFGTGANGTNTGTAFGYYANAQNSGVALGNFASAQNSGIAAGVSALGDDEGIGIGYNIDGHGEGNIAIGHGFLGGPLGTFPMRTSVPDGMHNTAILGRGVATLEGALHWNQFPIVNSNGVPIGVNANGDRFLIYINASTNGFNFIPVQ